MKKILSIGKPLNKKEQKEIIAGQVGNVMGECTELDQPCDCNIPVLTTEQIDNGVEYRLCPPGCC